mgnify:FL=1
MGHKKLSLSAELIPQLEGGFTVWCPELDIFTEGETEKECLDNLREAALLHLEELGSPLPSVPSIRHRSIQLTLP